LNSKNFGDYLVVVRHFLDGKSKKTLGGHQVFSTWEIEENGYLLPSFFWIIE
jgi:hypothetical protein